MPTNPGDGEQFAARVARMVDATEEQLLRLIAQLLADGADETDWAATRLRDVQRLLWAAQRSGKELDKVLRQAVLDAILDSINVGTMTAITDLPAQAPVITGAAVPTSEALAAATQAQISQAIGRMPSLLQRVYEEAVHAGASTVLDGRRTRLQAAQSVLDRLLGQGIRGYRDSAGRSWSLDTYVEMSVRTVTGQAATQAHLDQLQHAGRDLVIVSDAPRECPACRPWEGKVLSISGRVGAVIETDRTTGRTTTVVVAGSVADAKAAGLQHPNCRHSLSSYVPGATRSPRSSHNPDGYEHTQRQRAMERKIREWKRREALALTPEAQALARGKVRSWQGQLRAHVAQHDLKRLRYREQASPLAH
ncbi:phage capsid protein [Yimella sp. cx-573]|nr:phage capsid protein [Yimella sp. cx-573]